MPTAVRVTWSGNNYISTTVRYECVFNETGTVVTSYERKLPPHVTSTDFNLCEEDTVPEYEHIVVLQQNAMTVTTLFDLGMQKSYIF